jgi:hypothetical protein
VGSPVKPYRERGVFRGEVGVERRAIEVTRAELQVIVLGAALGSMTLLYLRGECTEEDFMRCAVQYMDALTVAGQEGSGQWLERLAEQVHDWPVPPFQGFSGKQ